MRAAVALALLVAGAARAEEPLFQWKQPQAWEVAPLVAADALIWIDVAQTMRAVSRGPANEFNPFLGRHPDASRVFWIGGVASTLAMAVCWYALPSKWRTVLPGAVIGGEGYAVVSNSFGF